MLMMCSMAHIAASCVGRLLSWAAAARYLAQVAVPRPFVLAACPSLRLVPRRRISTHAVKDLIAVLEPSLRCARQLRVFLRLGGAA